MKHLFILILLATVASARGAIKSNQFTTNSNPVVNYNGVFNTQSNFLYIGPYNPNLDWSRATNGILIGAFDPNAAVQYIQGGGIMINGLGGGGASVGSIAIGNGAGAGTDPPDGGYYAVSIGDQSDAFGRNSISLGQGIGSQGEAEAILIGTGLSPSGWTNVIMLSSFVSNPTKDNSIVLGDSRMVETKIYGKVVANGGGITNINTTNLTWTIVNTNFVQGFIYTNFYGAPIEVNANIRVTTAAVAGDSDMDLQQPAGTLAARVGLQSVAAQTNECHLIWKIPINGTYAITNTLTTGAGNAVIVIGGQIFVY